MRNPWAGLGSSPPYVTAEDEPYIEAWNRLPAVAGSPFRLHLDLPPEPFVGPHDAPLVVLSANPSWAAGDAEIYQRPEQLNALPRSPWMAVRASAGSLTMSRTVRAGGGGADAWAASVRRVTLSTNCRNASWMSSSTGITRFAGPRCRSPSRRNGSGSPLWNRR